MRLIHLALLPMFCSLAIADEPDRPYKLKIGVVNIDRVYESSLSRQQKTFFEEVERMHLRGTHEINERKMHFQRQLTRWQELQKEIADAKPDETAILQREANHLESEFRSLDREHEEMRSRRVRAHPEPSVRLHRMRMSDALKAARNVGESRGIDLLFNSGEAQSSLAGEDDTAIVYARESMDFTNEAIAELRKMHGNEGLETEPVPRLGDFTPWDEPVWDKADFEEDETITLTKPE